MKQQGIEGINDDICRRFPSLTAVVSHSRDGPRSVKEQLLVGAGQRRQQSRDQACVAEAFANHGWKETKIKLNESLIPGQGT